MFILSTNIDLIVKRILYLILTITFAFICKHEVQCQEVDSTSISLDSTDSKDVLQNLDSLPKDVDSKKAFYHEQMSFLVYLISNELYDDASFVIHDLLNDTIEFQNFKDSLLYYDGWISYFRQNFRSAIQSFSQIDSSSSTYIAASFYRSICYVQIDSTSKAKEILEGLTSLNEVNLEQLRLHQLAGIALLQREYESFDSITIAMQDASYLVNQEKIQFAEYSTTLQSFKRKSPWVAGLLSALLPGLGKFYAGYRGIPFGATYMTIPLGAVAAESLILAGVASAQFIILGGVFAVFYVGNIWGSALSVYAKEREFYDEMDYNIEFDMHSPIRRAFN